ncbi:MAG: prolyl oligopeptidase family serine peptidase [Opitutaceae bacterium]|nr:prolyl oligopeptidase family serine peptidase [Opitutaceae bacterium]
MPLRCSFAALVSVAGVLRAASFDDRVEMLLRPELGERMAISPEGRRVAYTSRDAGGLAIVVVDLDSQGVKRTVRVEPDREAGAPAEPPGRLRFLRWATADRLVFAPTAKVVPLPPLTDKDGRSVPNPDGPTIVSPILAMDADGRQRGTLVDARDFQETPAEARRSLADLLRTTKELVATRNEPVRWRMPQLDILGFLPRERDQLIIQTRGAYSMPMQHLVDIRTGHVREFGANWPVPPGEPQVFDGFRLKVVGERTPAARPTTTWSDAELAAVQRELEKKFPRRAVEIIDWSETRSRVLVRVTGGSDPGRIFVFQRPENLVVEILRCAPWLSAARLNETRYFECTAADGAPLGGYVTWPKRARATPPPLLVVFPAGFPGGAQPAFDPEAEIFADLGYVVARLNHRSVAGVRPADLTALRTAIDRVGVSDARTVVEWIATRHPDRPFDRQRVATLGRGLGGYLAVRALQLEPALFRRGVAIDAPLDLQRWLRPAEGAAAGAPVEGGRDLPAGLVDHAGAEWEKLSVVTQVESLSQPLLVLVEPGRSAAVDTATRELRVGLQRLGRGLAELELDPGFRVGQPAVRSAVYRRIDAFLAPGRDDATAAAGPGKEDR